MRVSRFGSYILVAGALALAIAGCGGTATLVDPGAADEARQLKASAAPVVVAATPTPAPTPTPVMAKLQATLTTFDRPLLGLGKSTATFEITNPSNVSLTGTLKVTFLKKGETTSDRLHTQSITVGPNGKQTVSIVETTWLVSSATAEIEMANGGYDPYGGTSGVY